jgi:hypothetical protein
MAFTFQKVDTHILKTRAEVIRKAEEINALDGSEGEREGKERREDHIKEVVLSDEMIPFIWAVAHVSSDRTSARVNGMHSSHVFTKLTDADWQQVRFPVVIIEEHFTCDTPKDRAYLFNQFDAPWSARSREDKIGAHLVLHSDLKGLGRYAANRATQGLVWYLQRVEGYASVTEARAQFEIIHQNHDIHRFLQFCRSLQLDRRKTAELGLKPVIAAMYHTTRRGDQEAQQFWRMVSGGKGSIFSTDSHHYKLADFLDKAREPHPEWSANTRHKFLNKRSPNDIEVFATCLRLFAAEQGGGNAEMVERLRERTAQEVAEKFWPLSVVA